MAELCKTNFFILIRILVNSVPTDLIDDKSACCLGNENYCYPWSIRGGSLVTYWRPNNPLRLTGSHDSGNSYLVHIYTPKYLCTVNGRNQWCTGELIVLIWSTRNVMDIWVHQQHLTLFARYWHLKRFFLEHKGPFFLHSYLCWPSSPEIFLPQHQNN